VGHYTSQRAASKVEQSSTSLAQIWLPASLKPASELAGD